MGVFFFVSCEKSGTDGAFFLEARACVMEEKRPGIHQSSEISRCASGFSHSISVWPKVPLISHCARSSNTVQNFFSSAAIFLPPPYRLSAEPTTQSRHGTIPTGEEDILIRMNYHPDQNIFSAGLCPHSIVEQNIYIFAVS
jgi:hypothetical protein